MHGGQFAYWYMANLRDNVPFNYPAMPSSRAGSNATFNVSFEPMMKILGDGHFGGLDVTAFIALAKKARQLLLRFSFRASVSHIL
jgi:hypothetical protein